MCFVPDETKFTQILEGFLRRKQSFTSLAVKNKLRKNFPEMEWNQVSVGNELRSRFNRGEFGRRIAKIVRKPAVHIVYCNLPTKKVVKK